MLDNEHGERSHPGCNYTAIDHCNKCGWSKDGSIYDAVKAKAKRMLVSESGQNAFIMGAQHVIYKYLMPERGKLMEALLEIEKLKGRL